MSNHGLINLAMSPKGMLRLKVVCNGYNIKIGLA